MSASQKFPRPFFCGWTAFASSAWIPNTKFNPFPGTGKMWISRLQICKNGCRWGWCCAELPLQISGFRFTFLCGWSYFVNFCRLFCEMPCVFFFTISVHGAAWFLWLRGVVPLSLQSPVYTYMYIHKYTHIHTYIHTYTYIHTCLHIFICIYFSWYCSPWWAPSCQSNHLRKLASGMHRIWQSQENREPRLQIYLWNKTIGDMRDVFHNFSPLRVFEQWVCDKCFGNSQLTSQKNVWELIMKYKMFQ